MRTKLPDMNSFLVVMGSITVTLLGIFIPKRLNRKENLEADKIEDDNREKLHSGLDKGLAVIRDNYEGIVKNQNSVIRNLIEEIDMLKKDIEFLRLSEKKLWKENQELRTEISGLEKRIIQKENNIE